MCRVQRDKKMNLITIKSMEKRDTRPHWPRYLLYYQSLRYLVHLCKITMNVGLSYDLFLIFFDETELLTGKEEKRVIGEFL